MLSEDIIMYAIIEDSGSQIKVEKGSKIKVDLRDLAEDQKTIEFDRVLLVGGEETKIGAPHVAGAKVTAEILEQAREDKISVIKFKRRKGYRRNKGHRQGYLSVKVTDIQS